MAILGSRILVAYDSSEWSRKALETAVRIAGQDSGIALHVLHVLEPIHFSSFSSSAYGYDIDKLWGLQRENAEKMMDEVKENLQTLPNSVTFHIEEGKPGECIIQKAQEQQCDLIVMGSRGLTGIKELFLGSVSHYVVQRSACPVLIVK